MQKFIRTFVITGIVGLINLAALAQNPSLDLKEIANGFVSPIAAETIPDGSGRLMVCDQVGLIYTISADGKKSENPFFDLTTKLVKLNNGFDERGLLGLAFHPDFPKNGKFYLSYTAPPKTGQPTNWNCTLVISEFKAEIVNKQAATAGLESEKVLLEIDEPYFNHNGGRLAFGPDGFLYISVGDGGNGNGVDDENFIKTAEGAAIPSRPGHSAIGNGQDLNVLLAKILRIDVNKGQPYAIPAGNPLKDGEGRREIFAWGVRNPWGLSFDRGGKHELFVSDVGQNLYEEVNIIENGGNYGWPRREALVCFDPKSPNTPPKECPEMDARGQKFKDPIVAYKNINRFRNDPEAGGTSVTGGYVYRGKALPQLNGKYIFADWSKSFALPMGIVYAASPDSQSSKWKMEPLELKSFPKGNVKQFIPAMGQDENGEIYILTSGSNQLTTKTGKVFKIVPAE